MRILNFPPASLLSCAMWVWGKKLIILSMISISTSPRKCFGKECNWVFTCYVTGFKINSKKDMAWFTEKGRKTSRGQSHEKEKPSYAGEHPTETHVGPDFSGACNTYQPFCDESILTSNLSWAAEVTWATLTSELGCLATGSLALDCQLFTEDFWVYK